MKKKYELFFASLKSLKKEVSGTDPGTRIRTNMSRIPNTGSKWLVHLVQESACVRRAGRAPSAAWPSAVLAAGVPAGAKYLQKPRFADW